MSNLKEQLLDNTETGLEKGAAKTVQPVPPEDQTWWRCTHAFGFVLGGVTFWLGTFCYYYPQTLFVQNLSAWLYIIGSCGFMYVDTQEFFTFTDDKMLRLNISMSMTGSFLYIVGSAGFLPAVMAKTMEVGIWGFIGGSFAIGVSQMWKVVRISRSGRFPEKDTLTALGVEGGACLGAWGFFFGTVYFWQGAAAGAAFQVVLLCWMLGSSFFTFGGLCLTYRHAVMGVC